MFMLLAIFAVTYILIATEIMDKTIAAILGATLVVFLHYTSYEQALSSIDMNVVFLLAGMMIMVDIMSETGIFEWVAVVVAQKVRGNGVALLLLLLVITALFSALLDNVTTVLLIAPLTILITQILELPTVPFLILEALFSNIGGTATLVGDPPNIIIGSAGKLSFNQFLLNLGPIVLILIVVGVAALVVLLRRRLHTTPALRARITQAEPRRAILQPEKLAPALGVFALVITGFFVGRFIQVEPGIVALGGGFLMALVCRVDVHKVLRHVEWGTILFFAGLFMLVGALEENQVFEKLGEHVVALTRGDLLLTAILILWFSAITSAIVDNVPLVISMIPLLQTVTAGFARQMGLEGDPEMIRQTIQEPLLWSLALGACLGGNGTLIGASANVVVSQIARRNKYDLSFWMFTKWGLPVTAGSLILCSIYIYLRYFAFLSP